MAFFFVNFYKDFESKILYNSKIDTESDIYKECQQLHKDYDFHALNFDFGEFEHAITGNQTLINNYDPENDFNDIRAKLEALNSEFLNHRNQEADDLKNISAIGPRDISQINSIDSGDITGLAYYNDDKTAIFASSINLNQFDDTNSECDMISPDSSTQDQEMLTKAYSRTSVMRQSYSHLETKVDSLEKNLGSLIKNEAQLKGEISRLKIERDSFKKMLNENMYFTELQNAISSISTSILTNKDIGEIKFNHQIMLKSLMEDSLTSKMKTFEKKLSASMNENYKLKEKFTAELRRSSQNCAIATKYIENFANIIEKYNSKDHMGLQEKLMHIGTYIQSDRHKVSVNNRLTVENYDTVSYDHEQLDHEISRKEELFNAATSPKFKDKSNSKPRKLRHRKSVEDYGRKTMKKTSVTIDFSNRDQGDNVQQAIDF